MAVRTSSWQQGGIRRVRFLEPMTAAILSSHRVIPPFGLQGGEAGALERHSVERSDGTVGNWGVLPLHR